MADGGHGGVSSIRGSGGASNREEADRWLVTSEKLLASKDLQGAKTFAIRACESDPTRTEAADYILAICDILIAGENHLNDSNSPDWYSVLRLGRLTQSPEHVATQYRRLALLLNPSVNRLPFADQAFKLVSDAWFVLSDPSRKSLYDQELRLSQLGRSQSQSSNLAPPPPPPPHPSVAPPDTSTTTSFWTACPYCYVLYEYPKAYEECTLRCQDCRRAFQAVTIQKPPVEGKGDDVYFCSWVVFPIGFSGAFIPPSWSPISPLFACPIQKVDNDDDNMKKKRKEPASPRIYYDDDDIYVAISDDDCEDGGWQGEVQGSKKANVGKGKETVVRSREGMQNVESIGCSSSDVMSIPVSYTARKRTGSGVKNVGRLDLNVEFSNEAEEPALGGRRNGGNGVGSNREVDNMEGIGFFEGLDEFLNSLPILSVVGDDKIKAT